MLPVQPPFGLGWSKPVLSKVEGPVLSKVEGPILGKVEAFRPNGG
jgi:hypothetical protein